jgi:hypothetical protein
VPVRSVVMLEEFPSMRRTMELPVGGLSVQYTRVVVSPLETDDELLEL